MPHLPKGQCGCSAPVTLTGPNHTIVEMGANDGLHMSNSWCGETRHPLFSIPLLPTLSLTIHGHHVNDPILTPLIQSPVLNELSPIPIVYDMMNQSMLPSYTPHSNLNIRLFE